MPLKANAHRQVSMPFSRNAICGGGLQERTCRIVVIVGLVMMALPLALLCFADDDKCLGLSSESLQ